MQNWERYNNQRWIIEVCRNKVAELRASHQFKRVKIGTPKVYHGKQYYPILVVPLH